MIGSFQTFFRGASYQSPQESKRNDRQLLTNGDLIPGLYPSSKRNPGGEARVYKILVDSNYR